MGCPALSSSMAGQAPLAAQREELASQLRILVVGAPPVGGAGAGFDLPDAPHLRTQMHRFQVDRNAVRQQDLLQRFGELAADALLHREAAGEQPHQSGQLGQAEDVLVGDVADVRLAEERQSVVLAEGEERDGSFDDLADPAVRPSVAFGFEGGDQLLVAFVPAGGIKEGTQEAAGVSTVASAPTARPSAPKISLMYPSNRCHSSGPICRGATAAHSASSVRGTSRSPTIPTTGGGPWVCVNCSFIRGLKMRWTSRGVGLFHYRSVCTGVLSKFK